MELRDPGSPFAEISLALTDLARKTATQQYSEERLLDECLSTRPELHGNGITLREKAVILHELGVGSKEENSLFKAHICLKLSLSMLDELYGNDKNELTATVLHELAEVEFVRESMDSAAAHFKAAFQMKQELYGDSVDHSELAGILFSLARISTLQQNFEKAIETYGDFVNWQAAHLHGAYENQETVVLLYEIGSLALEKNEFDQAAFLLRKCYEMNRRVVGQMAATPLMADLLHKIACVAHLRGQLRKAYLTHKACLRVKKLLFAGVDDTWICISLLEAGRVAHERRDFDAANTLYEECCEMLIRLCTENEDLEDKVLLATALHEFGHLKLHFGFLDDAEELFAKSMNMNMEAQGAEDSLFHVAANLHYLGHVDTIRGRFEEAEENFQKSLTMKRRWFRGMDHPEVEETLFELGKLEVKLKAFHKAKSYFKESLKMKTRLASLGIFTARNVADAHHQIGTAFVEMKDWKAAEKFFKRSISMKSTISSQGNDDESIVFSLFELGRINFKMCLFDASEKLFVESLERLDDKEDKDTITAVLQELGSIALIKGEFDRAEKLYKKSLLMTRSILGDGARPEIARILCELGKVANAKENLHEAKQLLDESYEMNKSFVGDDVAQRCIAQTILELGIVARKLGQREKAEELYVQCTDALRKLDGSDVVTEEMVELMLEIGTYVLECGDVESAEKIFQQTLQRSRYLYGPTVNHACVVRSILGLARVSFHKGNDVLAEHEYNEALSMIRRLLGKKEPDHVDVIGALYGLAPIARRKGNFKTGEELCRKVIAMTRRLYGYNGGLRHVVNAINEMGMIEFEKGERRKARALFHRASSIQQRILNTDSTHSEVSERNPGLFSHGRIALVAIAALTIQVALSNRR